MNNKTLISAEVAERVLKLAIFPSLVIWRKGNPTAFPGFAHFVVMDPLCPPSAFRFDQAILHEETLVQAWDDPASLASARHCACLAWTAGIPVSRMGEDAPYLLTEEIPLDCGSAVINGLVVACGGVKAHYADAFCSAAATMCIAAAKDSLQKSAGSENRARLPRALMVASARCTATPFSDSQFEREKYRLIESDHPFHLLDRLIDLSLLFHERCYCVADLGEGYRWFDCTEISVRIDTFYEFILNNVRSRWFVGPAIER